MLLLSCHVKLERDNSTVGDFTSILACDTSAIILQRNFYQLRFYFISTVTHLCSLLQHTKMSLSAILKSLEYTVRYLRECSVSLHTFKRRLKRILFAA